MSWTPYGFKPGLCRCGYHFSADGKAKNKIAGEVGVFGENAAIYKSLFVVTNTRDYPKFCVTAKSGVNRVKFIMGGRRVIDCRLVYNITPVGRDVKTKPFISPLPSI